jgi:8-oxo-dGTP diphosphatase
VRDDGGRLARLKALLTRAGLSAFRRSPAPVRRAAVRAGTPSFTVGAVCAFVHDGHVLLLRQRHREDWSLPGGLLDRGESPADAVRREVREELAVTVHVGSPITTLVDPQLRRVDVIYRVDLAERLDIAPAGEAFRAKWMRPDQLGPDDEPTVSVLAELARASEPGAAAGSVELTGRIVTDRS